MLTTLKSYSIEIFKHYELCKYKINNILSRNSEFEEAILNKGRFLVAVGGGLAEPEFLSALSAS